MRIQMKPEPAEVVKVKIRRMEMTYIILKIKPWTPGAWSPLAGLGKKGLKMSPKKGTVFKTGPAGAKKRTPRRPEGGPQPNGRPKIRKFPQKTGGWGGKKPAGARAAGCWRPIWATRMGKWLDGRAKNPTPCPGCLVWGMRAGIFYGAHFFWASHSTACPI